MPHAVHQLGELGQAESRSLGRGQVKRIGAAESLLVKGRERLVATGRLVEQASLGRQAGLPHVTRGVGQRSADPSERTGERKDVGVDLGRRPTERLQRGVTRNDRDR